MKPGVITGSGFDKPKEEIKSLSENGPELNTSTRQIQRQNPEANLRSRSGSEPRSKSQFISNGRNL